MRDFETTEDCSQPVGTGIREIKKMYNHYANKRAKKELKQRAAFLHEKIREKQLRLIEKQKNSRAGSKTILSENAHMSQQSESDVTSELVGPNFPKFNPNNYEATEEELQTI